MRYLFILLVLVLAAAIAWPYWYLYRLDRALLENDRVALVALVDMDRLRENHKAAMEYRVEHAVGREGAVSRMLQDGVRWLSDQTGEQVIDLEWVRAQLRRDGGAAGDDAYPSILRYTGFAF
jgi:hypothetical protein